MADSEVKGVQINSTIDFLKDRFGARAVQAAIESLDPEDRRLLPSTILDSSWYPYEIFRPVRRISRALLPDNTGPDFAIDMGRSIAQYAFTGVYKTLLPKDPTRIVEKFSWLHGLFFREAVTLTAEVSIASCLLHYAYNDSVVPARSHCLAILGFWLRTLELSGATDVRGQHTACVRDGASSCDYSMQWGPAS